MAANDFTRFTFQQLLQDNKYQTLRDTLMEEYNTPKETIQTVNDYFNQVLVFYNPDSLDYDQAGALSYIISGLKNIIEIYPEYLGKFQCLEITIVTHNDQIYPDAGYIMYRFCIKQEYHKELSNDKVKDQFINSLMEEDLMEEDDACSWYKGFHNSNNEIIIYQETGY